MNRRGWIGWIGLGVVLAGCAPQGTTPAIRAAAQPVPKAVARALLSGEDVQALPAGGGRFEGSYQALKAVLAK